MERCAREHITKNTQELSELQEAIQKELENPREIFVNDSFTHGKQKTSEWSAVGLGGVERWINKKFNAARDKTSTTVNEAALKTIRKINSFTGKEIPEEWADVLVQPNSQARKIIDEVNSDTQLMNQRMDINEHYTFNLLEKYPKEQIESVAKALDGQIKPNDLDSGVKPLYEKIKRTIDKNANRLIELGVLNKDAKIEDYLKHYYKKFTDEKGEILGAFAKKNLGMDKTHKRKTLSEEQIEELGGLRLDSYAIVKTISEQMRQIQKAEQLENLAHRFGADEPIDGFVKISDESLAGGVKKYGALAGKYVPEDLARFINEVEIVSASSDYLLKNLMAITSTIKTNMTALNPSTHVYNVLSNLQLSLVNGDLASVISLAKIKKTGGAVYKKWSDLAQWYGLNGNMKAIDFDAPKGISQKGSKAYRAISNLWLGENSKLGEVFRNVYNLEDSVFKVAHFKRLMDSTDFDIDKAFKADGGLNLEYLKGYEQILKDAMKRGNYNYVDYNTRWSKLAQGLDRAAILPFIQYSWKAGPMVLRSIAQNPVKYLGVLAGTFGVGGLSLGGESKKEKNIFLPKWAKSSQAPNLFFQDNWVEFGDYYFNLGRMTPGVRLDGFNGFNFDMGFMGGIAHLLKGETTLGHKYIDEEASGLYQNAQILAAILENYAPPLSPLGRYGQRAIKMSVNGMYENDKDKPFSKVKDSAGVELSWEKYFWRLVGVREMPKQAEAQKALNATAKKMLKAKKENDMKEYNKLKNEYDFIIKASRKYGYTLKKPNPKK